MVSMYVLNRTGPPLDSGELDVRRNGTRKALAFGLGCENVGKGLDTDEIECESQRLRSKVGEELSGRESVSCGGSFGMGIPVPMPGEVGKLSF